SGALVEHRGKAEVQPWSEELQQAVQLRGLDRELLLQPLAGSPEQRFAGPGHPPGNGRLVHLIHRADLVEAQTLEEVEAEDVPLLGMQLAEGLAERAPELGAVPAAHQLELEIAGGRRGLELGDLGQRIRSASRVAPGIQRQAKGAGAEPILQRAAAGILE